MEETSEKYTPKEITNTKRLISNMKKNKNKRDQSKTSIFPVSGIYIFTQMLRKQNQNLLEKISEEMLNSEEEKEMFMEKYQKTNYYVPNISSGLDEEKAQKKLLKMMK